MSLIRAIPQVHRGIKYRSRTEARWAEFFYDQKIPFVYEAEGYRTDRGPYLPDFQFTGAEGIVCFEVKPRRPTPREYELLEALARGDGVTAFVCHGPPSIECKIEVVRGNGQHSPWFFVNESGATCGYLVDSMFTCKTAIPLRKTKNGPLMYARGPANAFERARTLRFDTPRRGEASDSLRRSAMVRQVAWEERGVDWRRPEREVIISGRKRGW